MSVTYKIGEAAALLNLKTYVLRFWETEFPQIAPLRTEKGQRLYTEEHLALLDRIRFLLHERGLTIEGTRKVLAEEASRGVRYSRTHGQSQDENAPALPGYGLAPPPQPAGAASDVPEAQSHGIHVTISGAQPHSVGGSVSVSTHGQAPPAPALEAESSGLTSGADRRKDIAIGLGVGFETVGAKRKTDAARDMEQGRLMQAGAAAAGEEGSLGNAPEETRGAMLAGQQGRATAPAPHSDWDDIRNAFNAGPEDDGWDLIQSGAVPDGREQAGTDARNAIKEITAELEAVAELLRGSTAGKPS